MSRLAMLAKLLPFAPLYFATNAASVIARFFPGRWRARPRDDGAQPGISVIVPERGTPDLLDETLAALAAALARIDEPHQTIVVVNGAPRDDYRELAARHPAVEWRFHDRPLGYNGAIDDGLKAARHDWTYLLNSDMRLDPDALAEAMRYRRAHVFAITSQIFFADPARRREETGWSDFHANAYAPEVYERTPEPGTLARGNLYPGGGSSLCRTAPLRRYVKDSRDYAPFYWEDADWGIRAWSDGYEVLFCPASHAWHRHRGTVNRYYEPGEVERVIHRNTLLFDLRHGWTGRGARALLMRIAQCDAATQAELRGPGLAWRAFKARLSTRRAQRRGFAFAHIATDKYYAPPPAPAARRPRVLLVSPFALFPPAHGGARRIAELVQRLSPQVDFVLLGDERSLYSAASEPWFEKLYATHLIEGRGRCGGDATPSGLVQRMDSHAWPRLRGEVARLAALYDIDIVQVEFMELARLAEVDTGRARRLLALHDVYLTGTPDYAWTDAIQHAAIARYDAVTACSAEDAALLTHPHVALIGNGAVDRRARRTPSPSHAHLLFMGPFRYAQNLAGIREFLDRAWPALKARIPDLRLTILGGAESAAIARDDARFAQPGVTVVSEFVDPEPWLAGATLTINPQIDIRGSSIKLIESLLAGRVCVSTADGARGFANACFEGLATAPDIAAMAEPIARLVLDDAERHRRERADDERLDRYTWDAMADRQLALYRQLLGPNGNGASPASQAPRTHVEAAS